MRLVGGTALALQFGHRVSVDLDFFGKLPSNADEMLDVLTNVGDVESLSVSKKIRVYNINRVKVDFVDYSRYPWIDNPIEEDGATLASPKDIAAMKVNAAEGRGTKKDFVDIYFLLQQYSLEEILNFYKQKYPDHSEFRALMSLVYFDDAEEQFMPKMLKQVSWEDIKAHINCVVKAYLDRH